MIRVQDLIHRLEVGEGTWGVRVFVGVLLVITLTAWYDLNRFKDFSTVEAMEAAQLARNLANGQGFMTKCIRPFSLYLVEKQQGVSARLWRKPHPDLANPPLYPLLLAGLMKVVPFRYDISPQFWRYEPEMIIAFFNQILFFLTVWLAYRLARRLFDRGVAVVTALALLGSETLWRFSVSGLSTNLALLIFTGLLGMLLLLEEAVREGRHGTRWFMGAALATGALVGLGALTRYAFAWLVLPVLAFGLGFLGPRRVLVCSLVVVAFLALFSPWVVRNYVLSGAPFGIQTYALYQDTQPFPDSRLERSLHPNLSKVEFRDYTRKFFGNMRGFFEEALPKLGGGSWVAAFFLTGLLLPFRNPGLGRLRLFLVGSLILLAVMQALGRTHLTTESPVVNSENLLVLLTPGIFIFGVAFFFVLLDQMRLAVAELRYLVIAGFVVVASGQLLFTLLPPRTYPIVYPPYLPPWIQQASRMLRPNELMMSDMPWAVAWYGDRSCVGTPLDTGRSFYAIYDEQKAISALYLTPLTTDARLLTQILEGQDWDWSRFASDVLLRSNTPPQFSLTNAYRGFTPDQLFLSDRVRW